MNITLNGNTKTCDNISSVAELLSDLTLNPETVVIELNTKIIPQDEYNEQKLNDADRVEIIRFVGGG